jgi:hypothetical protein
MVALTEATRYIPALPGPNGQGDSESIQYIVVALLIMALLRWRPQGIIPEKRDLDGLAGSRGPRWRPQAVLAEPQDRDSLAESRKQ